ncbi:MAG: hypothetical protein ACPIOQ_30090 [Promethearchaeia archaeon]
MPCAAMSTMGRQEQSSPEQTTVTELWAGQAAMHGASLCPPEPAHQRALSLLPMDVSHDSAGCASMDKKRQARATGGKKRNDHTVLVSAQRPSGRIGDLAAQKKARKKHKRAMQSRDDITIFPRRKAGQDKLGSNRPPIVISRTVLESYFNMPQQKVCEKLVRFSPQRRRLQRACATAHVSLLVCALAGGAVRVLELI